MTNGTFFNTSIIDVRNARAMRNREWSGAALPSVEAKRLWLVTEDVPVRATRRPNGIEWNENITVFLSCTVATTEMALSMQPPVFYWLKYGMTSFLRLLVVILEGNMQVRWCSTACYTTLSS